MDLKLDYGYCFFQATSGTKYTPSLEEEEKESIINVAVTRTIHFDKLINKSKDRVEQFVIMGAGYDTRCYGDLKRNNLKFFAMDQEKTQELKNGLFKKGWY